MVPLFAYAAPLEGARVACHADSRAADLPLLELGVGKAPAAASLAIACAEQKPDRVVLFGVCGIHRRTGLKPGDLCVVTANTFGDEGVEHEEGFTSTETLGLAPVSTYAADPLLSQSLAERLDAPLVMACCVSSCSGTDARAETMIERTAAVAETMEGAAVALVCDRFAIPWVELRAVSNYTGDRSLGEWDINLASASVQDALIPLIDEGFFDD